MSDSIPDLKTERRRELRRRLAEMTREQTAEASTEIRSLLENPLSRAKTVAAFAALPGEPDLMPMITSGKNQAEVSWHLPRVEGNEIQLFRVHSEDELISGAYGIREPDPAKAKPVSIESIDLFLVPGLGFDPATGQRLGRGKGFYDRFLAGARSDAQLIGIGFDCQLGSVPHEAHDVSLNAIFTQSGRQPVIST